MSHWGRLGLRSRLGLCSGLRCDRLYCGNHLGRGSRSGLGLDCGCRSRLLGGSSLGLGGLNFGCRLGLNLRNGLNFGSRLRLHLRNGLHFNNRLRLDLGNGLGLHFNNRFGLNFRNCLGLNGNGLCPVSSFFRGKYCTAE